ncbi:LysR family transcriptional regulator [Chromatiaceae bacterium AAb-1]|nr:LysR family transcriptional regulator [Chromatiaceae bacterium AAb-1]
MITDSYCELNSHKKSQRALSLTALRCFDVAARTESFSRAAEKMNLTHGAVSRAVRNLEDELGVQLFERRGRRVFLTEAGTKLAATVQQAFAMIENTTRELRNLGYQRTLTISCEPTLLMRWLIPRLPQFQKLYPELSVQLVSGGGAVQLGGNIDLAIRRNDFDWPDHYYAVRLFDESIGPVCRSDLVERFVYKDDDNKPRLRADGSRLHTRTRPDAWSAWYCCSGEQSDDKAPSQVFEHFYFSLQAAAAGIGIAIGPWHLVRDELDNGILTAPFGFIADGSGYYLLAPEPFENDSPQSQFLQWILSVAR